MRSPGRSSLKSAGMARPARACSRDVRGMEMWYFANTYFVKPEQSNPSLGVLPPQTYLVPTYASAVRSTRAASAVAGGELGIRRPRRDGEGAGGAEGEGDDRPSDVGISAGRL